MKFFGIRYIILITDEKGDFMKRNFIIALILTILCFFTLVGAIVLELMEQDVYCTYVGMASTLVGFFAVLFGINSWKEK